MARYIDADWLLDVVENIIRWDTERDRNRIIHQVRELTPAADVVEVVRCGNCLKYDTHDKRCKYWNHCVVVMNYCSKAERRTDEP